MAESPKMPEPTTSLSDVEYHLAYLQLAFIAAQYAELAKHAAHKAWSHVDYLASLVEGEADLRRDRATQSRIRLARFPVIKTLAAAKSAGRLKAALKQYTKPALLILDELGYLPIDKAGADLLFQVISLRYEQGAIIITSNRAFKEWPKIFNQDSTLTAAILDRLLHHADTVIIEGKSFRMKDQIES